MPDLDMLHADAKLASAISFDAPRISPSDQPQAILLTGVTGFLGAFLLNELLKQTDADIYCLVRNDSTEGAWNRLKNHLVQYGLWHAQQAHRIIVMAGNLGERHFGWTEADYEQLAGTITTIIHNGAWMNAMLPYAELRAVNVLGTLEILRFAAARHTKPVHYVSSMAIFFSHAYQGKVVSEIDSPVLDDGLRGGYKQTKWVAEQMIREAGRQGLPAVIHRPVRIGGTQDTGLNANLEDAMFNILKACVLLGKYPASDSGVYLTPVDYVSQSIVYLSQRPDVYGKAFHFCGQESVEWNVMMDWLRGFGYPLEALSYLDWIKAIKRYSIQNPADSFFRKLRILLRSPIYLFSPDKPVPSVALTTAYLSQSGLVHPRVDRQLLATYFDYFETSGFLKQGIKSA